MSEMTNASGLDPQGQNQKIEQQEDISELLQIRRDKLSKLQEEGRDPFRITSYPVDTHAACIREKHASLEPEQESGDIVSIAGRMMSKRVMGKASFSDLQDKTGTIQLYVRRDLIGEEEYTKYKKMLDIGDVIGVKGEI